MREQKKKNKKKETLRAALGNNFYLLKLAYKACPGRVIGECTQRAVRYFSSTYMSIIFIEFLLKSIENKTDFKTILVFLCVSVIGLWICNSYIDYYENITFSVGNQKLYENLHIKMFQKATDVELECYENSEFYNRYTKAASQIKGKAYSVINVLPELTIMIFNIAFLLYKTVKIDRFAVIFVIFPILSTYLLGDKINKVNYELYQKNVPQERKRDYVKRTVYLQNYAKEIRLSNIFGVLMKNFNVAIQEIIVNTHQYGLKLALLNGLRDGINHILIWVGTIVYATVRLLYFKDIQISDCVVLVNAISYLAWMVTQGAGMLNKVQDNSLYIQNIKEFLEYEPKISESQGGLKPERHNASLFLKNVSYTYLGQSQPVLKNINMEIKPKQKIALVGHNGAGKTTLVKLIMRLYDTTEGEILLNDKNIQQYSVREYRDLFATVFQDYKVLSLSVAENVMMGEVDEEQRDEVIEALKGSGVYDKVMTLKHGMDTTLTREFDDDGAVLSGGEYQKVAIARVFAKDCDIAILDEPSSALDPIAEYKMYDSMLEACKDKSVVFISHRLSSAVLADKIYMLENGEIVEEGSHHELMEKNGKYAEMFAMQAKSYA